MFKIAALWEKCTEDGKVYWIGNLGEATLLLYDNKFKKEGDKQPDKVLYLAESKRKNDPSK